MKAYSVDVSLDGLRYFEVRDIESKFKALDIAHDLKAMYEEQGFKTRVIVSERVRLLETIVVDLD